MRVICCVCAWVPESLGVCGMELHGQLDPPVSLTMASLSASSPESFSCDLADLTFGEHKCLEDR